MTAIPFPLRSNPAPFKFMGEPRLVNCFPEEIGQENRNPVAFIPGPTLETFAEPSDIPCRGAIPLEEMDAFYTLHGSTLYKMDIDGDETALSGLVAGSRPVIMERGPERFRSATVTVSVANPAVVTWTDHRLSEDASFQFASDGDLPDGIEADTTYYVRASGLTANQFTFSESEGGSAVETTSAGSGTLTVTLTTASYQIAIVSDDVTYVVEDDEIYFVDLPEPANSVTFLAGRFVYGTDSGRYYPSDLNNALVVDPLGYITAETNPDGMVRAFASGGELYLLGKKSIEVHSPLDDADQPFGLLPGSGISKGCAAPHSVAVFDNAVHLIGDDGVVYRLTYNSAERVSTHAVERAIERADDRAAIRSFVYIDRGHSFYGLTCPEWTWVFDAATGVWHERRSYQETDWRFWPYVRAFDRHIFGDKRSGGLYYIAPFEDYASPGEPDVIDIPELTLPDVPGRAIHRRLEIDLASGEGRGGAAVNDALSPKVMVSWSDDGGHTWSNERVVDVGQQGDWDRRVRLTRLGMARTIRGRRYRIRMSSPVKVGFMLGDLEVQAA